MLMRYTPWFAGDALLRSMLDPYSFFASSTLAPSALKTDIVEKSDGLEFVCDVPGATSEDVEITCENGILTISAQRKTAYGDAKVHASERVSEQVSRSFTIGDAYDTSQISASLKDGVLVVRVAKRPEAAPRRIPVLDGGQTTTKQMGQGATGAS